MSGPVMHVHIDRLVLDGIAVSAADRHAVSTALERQLAVLLRSPGEPPPSLRVSAATARMPAPGITVARDMRPAQLGTAVAGSVHSALGGFR